MSSYVYAGPAGYLSKDNLKGLSKADSKAFWNTGRLSNPVGDQVIDRNPPKEAKEGHTWVNTGTASVPDRRNLRYNNPSVDMPVWRQIATSGGQTAPQQQQVSAPAVTADDPGPAALAARREAADRARAVVDEGREQIASQGMQGPGDTYGNIAFQGRQNVAQAGNRMDLGQRLAELSVAEALAPATQSARNIGPLNVTQPQTPDEMLKYAQKLRAALG